MVLPGLHTGFFETAKTTLLSGFAALPYLLVIISGFFGAITGNLGLALLFLGQIFVVPFAQLILSLIRNTSLLTNTNRLGPIRELDPTCSLVPDKTKGGNFLSPITSNWVAQTFFFFGFLFTNALAVYSLEPEKGASPNLVEARKMQSMASLIISIVVFVALVFIYYKMTKCETLGSLLFGGATFGILGVVWFRLAVECGLKQADIFGIAGKIHTIKPDSAEFAKVCVPIINKTCSTECSRSTGRPKDCLCTVNENCSSNVCDSATGKCT